MHNWQLPTLAPDFALSAALTTATEQAAEYLQQRVATSHTVSFEQVGDESQIVAQPFFADETTLTYTQRQILAFRASQLGKRGLVVDGVI